MKKWCIEYWDDRTGNNSLEKWFDKLTDEQLKSVSKEIRLLEVLGNTLRLPHSKALAEGLFELRERRFGFRIYYCFCDNTLIFLLAAGDKKSQDRDIRIARLRLKQVIER
ncbi:type II toxin-antitoxin system RelE/ParE family toxin [Candidatus Dependentiae bacterium]|nr:type II toxin-antitoxin system RelE/ParE family toxin [Candidatus Dependentiae bacterium]MCC7414568.1 type II toxin-antitoxin system RelE/ParE family toxin [Campylobacterota bacterium]